MTLTLAVSELSTLCLSTDETANVTFKHGPVSGREEGANKKTHLWVGQEGGEDCVRSEEQEQADHAGR